MTQDENGFSHRPVMLDECIEGLAIVPEGTYIDGTAGGGGHSSAIASRLGKDGMLIAIDQDREAVEACRNRLQGFGSRVRVIRDNFCRVGEICGELGITGINGMLLDLGVSSHQLDTPERGFAYMADAPLDMRMDDRSARSAWDVVNTYSEEELKRILWEYGEERYAGRIAHRIVQQRQKHPIDTTGQLSGLIREVMPAQSRETGHHPAKRSFQAIRIEVNRELDVIEPALRSAVKLLRPGGRICVLTFHSLEEKKVKQVFDDLATGCTCPKSLPVCVCGRKPVVRWISRKPVLPGAEELQINTRARSAKLRIVEKI